MERFKVTEMALNNTLAILAARGYDGEDKELRAVGTGDEAMLTSLKEL
jgi:hypothetical protein